jgi:hypothetical protein
LRHFYEGVSTKQSWQNIEICEAVFATIRTLPQKFHDFWEAEIGQLRLGGLLWMHVYFKSKYIQSATTHVVLFLHGILWCSTSVGTADSCSRQH